MTRTANPGFQHSVGCGVLKALNDKVRKPWLSTLHSLLVNHKDEGAVLACSALKESYRHILEGDLAINWVHLEGDFELIQARMQERAHFMPASLLQSQFDALEPLNKGLSLSIENSPDQLVHAIKYKFSNQVSSDLGIIGMGVMGKSLALNAISKGISTVVYNRATDGEEHIIADLLTKHPDPKLKGFTDWNSFFGELKSPRTVLMMIPAGPAIDAVISEITPFLNPGDCLVDGGNSHYKDTAKRIEKLKASGIAYLGMGVSGGEEGALKGPAMMPGGDREAFELAAPLLEKLAAKDPVGNPCFGYLGKGGSGHLVKTVHNGIEYAEMQLLAEMYSLLSASDIPRSDFGSVFDNWNKGEFGNYLLGIMPDIMNKKDGADYLLEKILPMAGAKGTGTWTAMSALEHGRDMSISMAAVNARNHSSASWYSFPSIRDNVRVKTQNIKLDLKEIVRGYQAARILNHLQGLQFIRFIATYNFWELDLAEVTRIWTNGCILKSNLIEVLHKQLSQDFNNLNNWSYSQYLALFESFKYTLKLGWEHDLHMPVFNAAWQFGLAISSGESNANVIQAQRDYFGAHTYKRKDHPSENYHTDWTKP